MLLFREKIANVVVADSGVSFVTDAHSFTSSCVDAVHALVGDQVLPESVALECSTNSDEADVIKSFRLGTHWKQTLFESIKAIMSDVSVSDYEKKVRTVGTSTSVAPDDFILMFMEDLPVTRYLNTKNKVSTPGKINILHSYPTQTPILFDILLKFDVSGSSLIVTWEFDNVINKSSMHVSNSLTSLSSHGDNVDSDDDDEDVFPSSSPSPHAHEAAVSSSGEYYLDTGDFNAEAVRIRALALGYMHVVGSITDSENWTDSLDVSGADKANYKYELNGEMQRTIYNYFTAMLQRRAKKNPRMFDGQSDESGLYNRRVISYFMQRVQQEVSVISQHDSSELIIKLLRAMFPKESESPFTMQYISVSKSSVPKAGDTFYERYGEQATPTLLRAELDVIKTFDAAIDVAEPAFTATRNAVPKTWLEDAKAGYGKSTLFAKIDGDSCVLSAPMGSFSARDIVEVVVDGIARKFQNMLDPKVIKVHDAATDTDISNIMYNHTVFNIYSSSLYFKPLSIPLLTAFARKDPFSEDTEKVETTTHVQLYWGDIQKKGTRRIQDLLYDFEYMEASEQILSTNTFLVMRCRKHTYVSSERNLYFVVGVNLQKFNMQTQRAERVGMDSYSGIDIGQSLEIDMNGVPYVLTGMVCHSSHDLTANCGHYISIVRTYDSRGGTWYCISDSTVNKCRDNGKNWVPIDREIGFVETSCSALIYAKKSLTDLQVAAHPHNTPVGVHNPNNFCFSNACFQALCNLPDISRVFSSS